MYALHAPEVERISKGKARTPYEFGVKVTVATTLKYGLVVGMRAMPGNPWDGQTLAETVEQASILKDNMPKTVIFDLGYQDVGVDGRLDRNSSKKTLGVVLHALLCGADHNIWLLMKRQRFIWHHIN